MAAVVPRTRNCGAPAGSTWQKGNRGGVGSLALLPAATSSLRAGPSRDKSESGSPNHLTKIDHANN
jgi:hypothetical protein